MISTKENLQKKIEILPIKVNDLSPSTAIDIPIGSVGTSDKSFVDKENMCIQIEYRLDLSLKKELDALLNGGANAVAAAKLESQKLENALQVQLKRLKIEVNRKKRSLKILDSTYNGNSSLKEEAKSRNVIPSHLPKFRQNGYTEPHEFMEAFQNIMIAYGVTEDRYLKILPLYLDTIDNQWLKNMINEQNDELLN